MNATRAALAVCPSGYYQAIHPIDSLPYCVPSGVTCPTGSYPAGSDQYGWFCAQVPTGGPPVLAAPVPTLDGWALAAMGLALAVVGLRRISS